MRSPDTLRVGLAGAPALVRHNDGGARVLRRHQPQVRGHQRVAHTEHQLRAEPHRLWGGGVPNQQGEGVQRADAVC